MSIKASPSIRLIYLFSRVVARIQVYGKGRDLYLLPNEWSLCVSRTVFNGSVINVYANIYSGEAFYRNQTSTKVRGAFLVHRYKEATSGTLSAFKRVDARGRIGLSTNAASIFNSKELNASLSRRISVCAIISKSRIIRYYSKTSVINMASEYTRRF